METTTALLHDGQEHRHASPVPFVRRTVLRDEIAFFELNGEHDVGGCRNGKHQMRERHRRCHPERKEKTEIQRVTNEAVGQWCTESHPRVRPADERQPYLTLSEEIEMIDEERDDQDRSPPGREERP